MFIGKCRCRQCNAMFELYCELGKDHEHVHKCPKCGSTDLENLPSWVPLTYNMDLYASPSQWKYECKQCQASFEMPVPSGPTEEQQRKCPSCGSSEIQRLTELAIEPPLYCS